MLIWVVGLLWVGLVFGDEPLAFEVPAPVDGSLAKVERLTILGRDIQSATYTSSQRKALLAVYYHRTLRAQGFQNTEDKEIQAIRKLRFKKQYLLKGKDLVIDLIITDKPEGAVVTAAKYLQERGSEDIEKSPVLWQEKSFAPPTQDTEGRDIGIIPRPPESVRWMSLDKENRVFLTYASSLPVNKLRDFYKSRMDIQGWQMERETSAGQALNTYKKAVKKKDLGINLPYSDGEDLEKIIYDAYLLDFKGAAGKARITIFPNFVDGKSGSVVQINYEQAG